MFEHAIDRGQQRLAKVDRVEYKNYKMLIWSWLRFIEVDWNFEEGWQKLSKDEFGCLRSDLGLFRVETLILVKWHRVMSNLPLEDVWSTRWYGFSLEIYQKLIKEKAAITRKPWRQLLRSQATLSMQEKQNGSRHGKVEIIGFSIAV